MRATTVELLDPELARSSRVLHARAEGLRARAPADGVAGGLLAAAERRRAAELDLASWALAARAGLHPDEVDPTTPHLRTAA